MKSSFLAIFFSLITGLALARPQVENLSVSGGQDFCLKLEAAERELIQSGLVESLTCSVGSTGPLAFFSSEKVTITWKPTEFMACPEDYYKTIKVEGPSVDTQGFALFLKDLQPQVKIIAITGKLYRSFNQGSHQVILGVPKNCLEK